MGNVIIKWVLDATDYKQQLEQLAIKLKAYNDTQDKIRDNEKANMKELANAAKSRKKAIQDEEFELKKLEAGLKKAFTVTDISKFNSEIAKTKSNISVLKGEVGGIGSLTKNLGSQFAAIGAGIAAAFSVDAVIAFGKESIQAFLEADENAQRLKNSLKEVGEEGAKAFDVLINQSEKLAQTGVTIFTDDDIQRAQAQLANFGLTAVQIEKLIPKLADYASATKQNIVDASAKVGNALLGQGRDFKKYGIFVDAAKTSTENLGVIMDGFGQFEGRAAKETETLTGKLADQKREVDELQESLGSKLAPAFVSLKESLLNFSLSIVNSFSHLGEIENSLRSLGLTAVQTKKIIAAGFDTEGQSEGTIKTINNLKNLTHLIEFYNESLVSGKLSTVDYYNALAVLNKNITYQNTQTKEGQIAQKLLQNGIKELTDTYIRLNPKVKEFTDLTKKSTDELLQLKALSQDDRDLTILIDRELALRKKQEDALKKQIELQKKAAAEREKIDRELQKKGEEIIKDIRDSQKVQSEKDIKDAQDSTDRIIEIWQGKEKAAQDIQDELNRIAQEGIKQNEEDEKASLKRKEERMTLLRDKAIELETTLVDALFAIETNNLNRKHNQETEALEEQKDAELNNKSLTEQGKERINKEYAKKEKELARKQFEESKRLQILQATMKGALAVINALATSKDIYVGLILAASVAAETAAEIAVINSQKYARGTKKAKGGVALVGEEGPEFMYVPGGAKILTAQQTKKESRIIDAIYENRLDKLLYQDYVLPALKKQSQEFEKAKEKTFADNFAKALIYQGLTGQDMEVIRKKGTPIANVDELVFKLAQLINKKDNPRRR